MGTTRLQLYNDALILCGERSLANLTEERKPRYLLDQVWDGDGISACLEAGQWQFAMRTQQIYHDPELAPPFGYQYGFNKPDDWVLTSGLCSDEYFTTALKKYRDEVTYWVADIDPIYVMFVSDDDTYGADLSRWPRSFCDYAAAYFASKVIHDLTGDNNKITRLLGVPGDVKGGELARRLTVAKSRAAMTQSTQMPLRSSWVRSRSGRGGGPMGDGGVSGSLIG